LKTTLRLKIFWISWFLLIFHFSFVWVVVTLHVSLKMMNWTMCQGGGFWVIFSWSVTKGLMSFNFKMQFRKVMSFTHICLISLVLGLGSWCLACGFVIVLFVLFMFLVHVCVYCVFNALVLLCLQCLVFVVWPNTNKNV